MLIVFNVQEHFTKAAGTCLHEQFNSPTVEIFRYQNFFQSKRLVWTRFTNVSISSIAEVRLNMQTTRQRYSTIFLIKARSRTQMFSHFICYGWYWSMNHHFGQRHLFIRVRVLDLARYCDKGSCRKIQRSCVDNADHMIYGKKPMLSTYWRSPGESLSRFCLKRLPKFTLYLLEVLSMYDTQNNQFRVG